jgi:BMFP domain-containing protein YqiC
VVSSYSDSKHLARIQELEARIAALEHKAKPASTPKHRPKS